MTAYSPGPWRWKEPLDAYEEPVLLDANGIVVCHFGEAGVRYEESAGMPPDAEAAALIALAPELLDAVRLMYRGLPSKQQRDHMEWLLARLPKPAEGGEG